MKNFHIIWIDQTGVEHTTHICAQSFEDACQHIGCDPATSKQDDFGVSWGDEEIIFPIPDPISTGRIWSMTEEEGAWDIINDAWVGDK